MVNERITIINAPAGSGKTTQIEEEIKTKIKNNMKKKILCLTYTNRAVEEIKSRINHKSVDIFTIHSFLQRETKLIFNKPEIISLYVEVFTEKITSHLTDENKIIKYKNRLNIDEVKQISITDVEMNIKKIYYSEKNFSNYLYGSLSHDDLLYFVYKINEKYDYFKVKINGIYEIIYLDEYQDTDRYIINFLKEIIEWRDSKLLFNLYGDNMQKIYGSENKLERINGIEKIINKNYRSSNQLIRLFNSLYSQEKYKVDERDDNEYIDYDPVIKIYSGDKETLELKENSFMNLSSNYNDIFSIIVGSSEILDIYNKLERDNYKLYSYTADLKASDLLMNQAEWHKDILLNNLKIIFDLHGFYENEKYGKLINKIRCDKNLKGEIVKIESHKDRNKVYEIINRIFKDLNIELNYKNFFLKYNEIFQYDILNEIEESFINYDDHMEKINIKDIFTLYNYLNTSNKEFDISTQHGVKGESHYNINLICKNNNQSNIDYKLFFEYFSKYNIDVLMLENEYEKIINQKNYLLKNLEINKEKELTANLFEENKGHVNNFITNIEKLNLQESKLFFNCSNIKNKTGLMNVFKDIRKCEKYILTFKIFYVGCSRARERLVVKVNCENIKDYRSEYTEKMKEHGFSIVE